MDFGPDAIPEIVSIAAIDRLVSIRASGRKIMGKWRFFGHCDLRVPASTVVEADTFNKAEVEAHERFDSGANLGGEDLDDAQVIKSLVERHEEIEPEK